VAYRYRKRNQKIDLNTEKVGEGKRRSIGDSSIEVLRKRSVIITQHFSQESKGKRIGQPIQGNYSRR